MELNSYRNTPLLEQVDPLANNIKFAKSDDIAQIMAMGYTSMRENKVDHISEPVFEKALLTVTMAVTNEVVLVRRNVDNPKLIDGVLGMKHVTTWFSTEPYLGTFLFFIKEEYRSFKLARDFLNTAKEYGIINDIPIVFDLFAQKDVQKKIKLLKYLGFEDCGSLLIFKPIKERISQ